MMDMKKKFINLGADKSKSKMNKTQKDVRHGRQDTISRKQHEGG